MFYRVTGTYHTRYEDTRQLWPLRADRWLVIVIAALALAAPFYLPDLYLMSYMLPWLIWTMAALALTLLMGIAGQVHFGFAAVMAIGAYTCIHLTRAGVPFELAVLGAGFMAAVIGAIFGTAALRVKGLYLVVATLAMQYLIGWITVNVPAVSGGPQATLLAPPVKFLFVSLQSSLGRYYVALFWVIVVTLIILNIKRSSFGRALVAVRDKDYAAQVIGVDIFRYKLLAFWTSSFLGGIAGAILAFCYYQAVTPEQFSFDVSIQLVAMVLVGGLGSVVGAYLGSAFVLLLPMVLTNLIAFIGSTGYLSMSMGLQSHIPHLVYGMLIIGFLLVEPLGLAKIYLNIRNYFLLWPFNRKQM